MKDQDDKNNPPGLYLLSIDTLLEVGSKAQLLFVKNAVVGQNNLIDYYSEEERIGFMQNYRRITVVPVIHRSVINFIGMKSINNYYTFARKYDKFYALEKNNVMTVWCITTGKVLS